MVSRVPQSTVTVGSRESRVPVSSQAGSRGSLSTPTCTLLCSESQLPAHSLIQGIWHPSPLL